MRHIIITSRIPATVLSIGSLYLPCGMVEGFLPSVPASRNRSSTASWSKVSVSSSSSSSCLFPLQQSRLSHPMLHWKQDHYFTSMASLYAENAKWDESSLSGAATARLSGTGTKGLSSTTTNPVNAFLTILASDVASIALGLIGLAVVMADLLLLPSNAQLALLVPIRGRNEDNGASSKRVLVFGSNRAKSFFTPRDVAWCRIVTRRMASTPF